MKDAMKPTICFIKLKNFNFMKNYFTVEMHDKPVIFFIALSSPDPKPGVEKG